MHACLALPLPTAIVAAYRSWSTFETARSGHLAGLYVLMNDLSLIETPDLKFTSVSQVRDAFEMLLSRCEHEPIEGQSYTVAKLRQSLAYLDQPEIPNGQRIAQEDLDRRGIRNFEVSEAAIDQAYAQFKTKRSEVEGSKCNGLSVDEYLNSIVPIEQVASMISEQARRLLEALYRDFPWLVPCDFTTESVESDDPWLNIVTKGPKGIRLIINTHPRVRARYNFAYIDQLASHEICGHALHYTQLLAERKFQDESPHLICLTSHSQDSYFIEGIGQFMSMLVSHRYGEMLPMFKVDMARYELKQALRYQLCQGLVSGAIELDQVVEKHCSMDPVPKDSLRHLYQGYVSTRFFGAQGFTYYPPMMTLKPLLELDTAKLSLALKNLFTVVWSPEELSAFVAKVTA